MTKRNLMTKEIMARNYEIGGYIGTFSEFREIRFLNINLPKVPISCRECDKRNRSGSMRPINFVVKGRNIDTYNIFVMCKCSACNQITYIRYTDYLEQTLLSPSKKRNPKEKEEREVKVIKEVYKCTEEQALELQREHKKEREKTLKRMEAERAVRLDSYEERERARKSAEKKSLIESGELLYDKKNRVFYYKSTGKVYR